MKSGVMKVLCSSVLLIALILGGCSSSSSGGGQSGSEKNTFTFATWAVGDELKEFQAIVDKVNEAAEGRYTIEVLSVPSDYYIKVSTFIASNNTPDFFWLTQELLPKYAQLGAIADLTQSFTESDVLKPENYYEGVLTSGQYDGKYYGLPWIANPLMLYYNKNLFDEAGVPYPDAGGNWSWEEMIQMAEQLTMTKQDGLGNDYQQYGYIVDGWPNIETFIWAGGGDIMAENTVDVLLDSEDSLKGLDILHDILSSGITPSYSEVASLGSNNVWFEQQRVAMFMGGIQDDFEKKVAEMPAEEQFEIGYAVMPKGLDGRSSAFNWTASTVMSSSLADSSLAYEALEAITLEFFQWKVAPPLKDSVDLVVNIDPLKEPALDVIEASLQVARSAYYVPEWNEINNLLWVDLYTAMLNNTEFDYKSEAKNIADKARGFIAENKER